MSFPALAAADESPAPRGVRGLDAWANESIQRGLSGSDLLRTLVGQLAASDVIVHVETTELSSGFAGTTRLALDAGEYRYIRITLDRRLEPFVRAATLAHELQQALELTRSGVRNQTEVQQLYERIGRRVYGRRMAYETTAAERAGARALVELRKARSLRSTH